MATASSPYRFDCILHTERMDLDTSANLKPTNSAEQALDQWINHESVYLKEKAQEILSHFQGEIHELVSHVEQLRSLPQTVQVAPDVLDDDDASYMPLSTLLTRRKIFRGRESELSKHLNQDHYQAVYNIFLSGMAYYAISVVCSEIFQQGSFLQMDLLFWSFEALSTHVIRIWFMLMALSFVMVPLVRAWDQATISTPMHILLYILLQACMFIITGPAIRHSKLSPAASLLLLCEQIRMSMKMHSFFRETYAFKRTGRWAHEKVMDSTDATTTTPTATTPNTTPNPATPEQNVTLTADQYQQFKQYLYFMFAPTLLYRNTYPRTPRIRWRFLLLRLIESAACVIFTYVIFAHFCVPTFASLPRDPSNIPQFINSIFSATLPGTTVFMLIFFLVFHCWLNAWAELLRFADREFYLDWWNATSLTSVIRKMSITVHDFSYSYLYIDLRHLGFAPLTSFLLAFSAVLFFIEYTCYFAFQMFFPAVSCVAILGLVSAALFRGRSKGQFFNIMMWFFVFISCGVLLVLISREWYARNTLTQFPQLDHESWIPYSWQLLLQGRL